MLNLENTSREDHPSDCICRECAEYMLRLEQLKKGELFQRIKKMFPEWFTQTNEDNSVTWALDAVKEEMPDPTDKAKYWNNPDGHFESGTYYFDYMRWRTKWWGPSLPLTEINKHETEIQTESH